MTQYQIQLYLVWLGMTPPSFTQPSSPPSLPCRSAPIASAPSAQLPHSPEVAPALTPLHLSRPLLLPPPSLPRRDVLPLRLALLCLPSLPANLHASALFLIAAYNLAASSPSEFLHLLSLEGTLHDAPEAAVLHSFLAFVLPPPLPSGFSSELTVALLAKDKRNAFGLMEPFWEENTEERRVRTYGIYPYGPARSRPLWAMPAQDLMGRDGLGLQTKFSKLGMASFYGQIWFGTVTISTAQTGTI